MKNQIALTSDVFSICERLKEIDQSYHVIFNVERNKFEVHSNLQRGNSYCFTIPYNTLDDRTIEFARKTRVSRMDKIIEEIDYQNKMLERQMQRQAVERLKEVLE